MPALQIVASAPLAGKSTVAVALAHAFSRGARVQLLRAGSSPAATTDATSFAAFLFAGTPGRAIDAATLVVPAAGEISILEADAGSAIRLDLPALLVVRGAPSEGDVVLAKALGERLVGTIATRVVAPNIEAVARDLTNAGLRPLAILPEDRALAAPSVDELRACLGADLLFDAENGDAVVDDVLIAPVYADPARPHFRRFASKAILAPYNKTDLHLVAIETQAACLVITGGHAPSPYVLDRAQHDTTTVLLAPLETPETVAALGGVWLTSRFRGERKLEIAAALLDARLDYAALLRKLA